MVVVTVNKDISGSITVSFPYDPQLVEKVKTIEGRKWHSQEKYWSFPNTDETLKKILEVFEGEEIQIDPDLQAAFSTHVIVRDEVKKQSLHNFEDLRRELISRKYSYKTVKGYIYNENIRTRCYYHPKCWSKMALGAIVNKLCEIPNKKKRR